MVALQYATRAKAVTNLTSVNLDEDKSSQIELLKRQLADLQRRLADRKLEYDAVSSHDAAEMAEKAAQVRTLRAERKYTCFLHGMWRCVLDAGGQDAAVDGAEPVGATGGPLCSCFQRSYALCGLGSMCV